MSNYGQYMNHWKNHRKDRFTQQCGGPVHDLGTKVSFCRLGCERQSFLHLMDSLKCDDFPVYVKQGSGGMWSFTNERDSFGTKISDMGEMRKFYYDYVV